MLAIALLLSVETPTARWMCVCVCLWARVRKLRCKPASSFSLRIEIEITCNAIHRVTESSFYGRTMRFWQMKWAQSKTKTEEKNGEERRKFDYQILRDIIFFTLLWCSHLAPVLSLRLPRRQWVFPHACHIPKGWRSWIEADKATRNTILDFSGGVALN